MNLFPLTLFLSFAASGFSGLIFGAAATVNPELGDGERRRFGDADPSPEWRQSLPPMVKSWVSLFAAAGNHGARRMADMVSGLRRRSRGA